MYSFKFKKNVNKQYTYKKWTLALYRGCFLHCIKFQCVHIFQDLGKRKRQYLCRKSSTRHDRENVCILYQIHVCLYCLYNISCWNCHRVRVKQILLQHNSSKIKYLPRNMLVLSNYLFCVYKFFKFSFKYILLSSCTVCLTSL